LIFFQVLEIENKNEKVIAFAWEPKGHRFAVIHGEGPRPDVSFYSMKSKTGADKLTLLTTLKSKQANALYWSPQVSKGVWDADYMMKVFLCLD
jgi:translation initiation factor 3 subunit B